MTLRILLLMAALVAASAITTACSVGHLEKSRYCGKHARGFTESEVTLEGVRLHVHEAGKGDPPVVLVHGFGGTSFSWRYLVPSLAEHHRVLTFDLPGHGYSEKPDHYDYTAVHLGKLLRQFLIEEKVENAILMGNSYGGAISLAAVVETQEEEGVDQKRIGKLVLIDSAGYPQKLPAHVALLKLPVLNRLLPAITPPKLLMRIVVSSMYGDGHCEKEQVAEYANAYRTKGTRRAFRQYVKQMLPKEIGDYTKKYKDVRVPTLVISGDRDKVVPVKVAEQFDQDIPESTLVMVKGAGHIPQEEAPDKVLAALSAFLGEPLAIAQR
ncbi:MAG: alpha/beta hydrolase [Acidobacteriota bacterium]